MSTAHNSGQKGDFAKVVLMPGDPLRAQWIAQEYLSDVKLVSSVRNILAFTGNYQGKPISVMASGMGMPSIGIYSYELFHEFDVEAIVRIGSTGAYQPDVHVRDIILADSCWSESTYARTQSGDESEWQYPSEALNKHISATAGKLGLQVITGPIHSSDVFYQEENAVRTRLAREEMKKLLCVEMESFSLFHNAKVLGKQAACLLTVSDSLVTGEQMTTQERQSSFRGMARLALEAGITY